jgi:zinc protease
MNRAMTTLQRIQPPVFPIEKVSIPEAGTYTLRNGIPVFLIEAGTEDVMRIEFTFRAGQVKEKLPLLASTTSMMLSEGSQSYSSEELNRLLDFHGAFINQYSEKDRAGVVLFFLGKHIEKILDLSLEILFRPAFPSKEMEALLNKRQRWFIVNRDKVQNLAADQFYESIFGRNHPYGHQVTEKDFEGIKREDLADYHSRYYTPGNMAIIASGRINPKTCGLLDRLYGDMANGKTLIAEAALIPAGETVKKVHVSKPGAVQTAIRIGSKTINKRDPDYPGLKILNTLLGGYFGSRLMKNIREEKGYTYGISSSLTSLELSGFKVISTDVGRKNYLKAIDEIYKEIEILQTTAVDSEELRVVKNYMSGEMVRMFDGPFALAESFRSVWEFGLDNSYYVRLAEKIRTIDPDEIIDLARTYYKREDLYEITAGEK